MTPFAAVLFALALALAGLGGAAAVARVFRDESDTDLKTDVVVDLGLPAGLVLAALPGWLLSAFAGSSFALKKAASSPNVCNGVRPFRASFVSLGNGFGFDSGRRGGGGGGAAAGWPAWPVG